MSPEPRTHPSRVVCSDQQSMVLKNPRLPFSLPLLSSILSSLFIIYSYCHHQTPFHTPIFFIFIFSSKLFPCFPSLESFSIVIKVDDFSTSVFYFLNSDANRWLGCLGHLYKGAHPHKHWNVKNCQWDKLRLLIFSIALEYNFIL